MKDISWKIDERNTVKATLNIWGRHRVFLNDKEVGNKLFLFGKTPLPFHLEDGRKAELLIIPTGFIPERELRADGKLISSEIDYRSYACLKCSSPAHAGEKFCGKCGASLPTSETQLHMKKLKEARNAIGTLAIMFLFFGVVMFFIQRSAGETKLHELAQYQSSEIFPNLINGKRYTVGELRLALQREPWSILALNSILASLMLGLFVYARKSPLPAVLIAFGAYISVQILNAIMNPASLGQGLVIKMMMIFILVKGLRSALELRKISA